MRRVLLALIVAILVVPFEADVDGQIRIGSLFRRKRPVVAAPPTIQIQVPVEQPTFATTATSISSLSGITTHAPTLGIKSVTWSNAATGGSGAATLGTGTFAITASAGSATIAQDTFNPPGSNADITTRNATPNGTWTEVTDTGTAGYFELLNGLGYVRPSATDTNDAMIATLAPGTALSGTNYTFSMTVAAVVAAGGVTQGLVFGAEAGATPNDYCAVVVYESSAATDLYLISVVAGTVSTLGTPVNADIGVGHVVELDRDGNTLIVKKNGTTVISTSSAACATGTAVGIFCGNIRSAGDDCNVGFAMDDVTLVDRGAVQSGIALNVGENVITITVTDTNDVTATDVIAVTRGASDTEAPTLTIQAPTSASTYTSSSATVILSGIAGDNLPGVTVAVSCTDASPGSPMVAGTTSWTAAAITLTNDATPAACTVTATDAAMNTTQRVLTIAYDTSDATTPTVTITTDGGSGSGVNFTTAASTVSLIGTCVDTPGCTVVTFSCPQCAAGGSIGGSGSWNISNIPLTSNVAHVITVQGCDAAGNCGTDSITVTRSVADLLIQTTTLPNGINGTAYPTTCITATGGVTPYTWSVSVGSLPAWATLNASTGCITGTPNAEATTNFTVLVTDSQGSPDTDPQALSITVVAAGSETAHTHFTNLLARGDCTLAYSLRPVASGATTRPTNCSNPHFRYQIQEGQSQNLLNSTNPGTNDYTIGWEYDVNNDSDANKQDGAALTMPSFIAIGATLVSGIDADDTEITVAAFSSNMRLDDSALRIDNELVRVTGGAGGVGCPTGSSCGTVVGSQITFRIQRAMFGTSAASHSAGASVQQPFNSLFGHQIVISYPAPTTDGNTYVWTWDTFHTGSYFSIDSSWQAQKSYILNYKGGNGAGGFWWEPRKYWNAGQGVTHITNPCVLGTHVYAMTAHNYVHQDAYNGDPDWSLTNTNSLGPGWGGTDEQYIAFPANQEMGAVAPNLACIPANTWVRHVIRLKQIANDYDRLDQWVCIEGGVSCTQIYTNVPVSVPGIPAGGTNALYSFWFRYNTSRDRFGRANGPLTALRLYARNWAMHTATTAGGTLNDLSAAGFLTFPVR